MPGAEAISSARRSGLVPDGILPFRDATNYPAVEAHIAAPHVQPSVGVLLSAGIDVFNVANLINPAGGARRILSARRVHGGTKSPQHVGRRAVGPEVDVVDRGTFADEVGVHRRTDDVVACQRAEHALHLLPHHGEVA